MTKKTPLAFMSYVHSDNKSGRLTTFRELLSDEVQMQIGMEFPIFQDRKDIPWGKDWQQLIKTSLDEIIFLIPIITPSFFNSKPCRDELTWFLARENALDRNDLILPVYYVDTHSLNEPQLRADDELAEVIAARQYADWRDLRFEPFTNPQVQKTLAQLGSQIRDALPLLQNNRKAAVKSADAKTQPSAVTIDAGGDQPTTTPLRKKDPPTRTVDPMHRGDFATIREAIKMVEAGTRILVRPGVYEEGLVIDKPLEIIGDGKPGDVVLQARGKHVILFQTTFGRVVNLTVRQMGDGKWYGVDIGQGRLELEDCDISSVSLSCVAIHGGSDPRLRRNRIHDSSQSGVFVYQNGQGTLEDNDIFGNALSGVSGKENGDLTLRRNRINDNQEGGVSLYDGARATLEDNDISANMFAGVQIKNSVHVTLRRNRIHNGKQAGVFLSDGARATVEDNDISANGRAGVQIKNAANVTLRGNRIHNSKQAGVLVNEGGQGTIEENDIFGNTYAGVEITSNADPTLRRNRIHGGQQSGIYVHDRGKGMIVDNDIFGNSHSGITLYVGAEPVVTNNRINENVLYGVSVYEKGGGTFEHNDLTGNTKGSWYISDDSKENIKRTNNKEE